MSLDVNTLLATQSLSQSGFDAAAKSVNSAKDKKLAESAKDFEAMFIAEMMKPMFEGIEVDPMFGGGKGEEIFRGMMLQEYGKSIAETGQIGIADHVKAQLLHMQEKANGEIPSEEMITHEPATL